MSFRQSKEILHDLERVLGALETRVQAVEDDGRDPRLELVARTLRDHFHESREALRMAEEGASRESLECWLQYEPDRARHDLEGPSREVDDLVELARGVLTEFHDRFHHLAATASVPRVRTLFAGLAQLSHRSLERVARCGQESKDL